MPSTVIGTAGHIDHGKSALVRALTGIDPDRLKEEQERGITIDLGFAHLDVGDVRLAFVDVPGHERFVKNMLAGAGGIDLVMLVVAANESVMPQTREHFEICRLLQVRAGVIVLTKVDVADAELQEIATLEVRELTAGSFLADAPVVKVSARTGAGIAELIAILARLATTAPRRPVDRPVRLPIDRVFTVRGFGTVVTGTLVAGRLAAEADLELRPAGTPVKVRGLQVHGSAEPSASAGQRVAANVAGVEVSGVARGDTLCVAGSVEVTRRIDVALEILPDAPAFPHGSRVRFHQGTTEVLGRVSVAGLRAGGSAAVVIHPGEVAYARIRLEAPAVLTRSDRFIIRAYSPAVTIGGGVVLDPQPPRGALRSTATLRRFALLDPKRADESEVVLALAVEQGAAGLPLASLVSRLGHSAVSADQLAALLCGDGRLKAVNGVLVATAVTVERAEALVAAIAEHHRARPLEDGLAREEARERLFSRATPGLFEQGLEGLIAAGRVQGREKLALPGHQVSLSAAETTAVDALDRLLLDAGLEPPDLIAAARDMGIAETVAKRVTDVLLRRGRARRLDSLIFHSDALEQLKRDVRGLKADGEKTVDIRTFKERYGVSRKYAIPLLEHLDRERVTRRSGASRLLL